MIEPETVELPLRLGRSALWTSNDVLVQPRRTIKVDVDKSDDDLLAAMKTKTRYNVRLAERRGVKVRRGGVRDVPIFYQLLAETAERDQFGIHAIEYFDDMMRVFGDDVALLLAEYEDAPAAGLLALKTPEEAIYMYGATRSEFQRHMPAYSIQFAAMQWAREAGCGFMTYGEFPRMTRRQTPQRMSTARSTSGTECGASFGSSRVLAVTSSLTLECSSVSMPNLSCEPGVP